MDVYLTPEAVAERLSINPSLVRLWLRNRELKGIKIGRLWRVPEKDLEAFLQAQTYLGQDREPVAVH